MPRIVVHLFAMSLLFLCVRSEAGVGRWTRMGPEGGSVTALAVAADSLTVYAGTPASGLYKSTDGGSSWFLSGEGLRGAVRDLKIHPTVPAIVYAATSKGVFRSTDAGESWQDLTSALPGVRAAVGALAVAVEPAAPRVVWVSLDRGARVYRSTDRGTSWRLASAGLTAPAQALAAHPSRAGALFAATASGLWKTLDAGRTWTRTGLTQEVREVAVDPHRPERLYAAQVDIGWRGLRELDLVYSEDGGSRWEVSLSPSGFYGLIGIAYQPETPQIAPDPFTPGVAYAAIPEHPDARYSLIKTTDGGETWQGVETGDEYITAFAVAAAPARQGLVFAGLNGTAGDAAVLRSVDGGGSFTPSDSGIQAAGALQVVPSPAAAGVLYAYDDFDLWRTDDRGAHWSRLADISGPLRTVAADPFTPGLVYKSIHEGTFKSQDAGMTWSPIAGLPVRSLVPDPARPGTFWAASANGDHIVKTENGGLLWQGLPGAQALHTSVLALAPSDTATVYANGIYNAVHENRSRERVRRSTDGGATWTTLITLSSARSRFSITDFAIDPRDRDHALASFKETESLGTRILGGVLRTTDGTSWTQSPLTPANPPALSLLFDPLVPSRVYAGSDDTVFLSLDGGATWVPMGEGLPAAEVRDLRSDPFDPETIYAATSGGLYSFTWRTSGP